MTEAVVVRYRTHGVHATENERLVKAVFDQLRAEQPEGLRYATFRLGDLNSFLHVALLEQGDRNPLPSMDSFQEFQRHLGVRCEVAPNAERGVLVDQFGFFNPNR